MLPCRARMATTVGGVLRAASIGAVDDEERGDLLEGKGEGKEPAAPASGVSAFLRANAKVLLLVAVVTQNSGYSLLRQYASSVRHSKATTSSILAAQELLKLLASCAVLRSDPATVRAAREHSGGVRAFVFQHSFKMIVPASMYLVMNILGFIALAHISAGLFAVIQQCKLIFTAVLSRLLLRRALTWGKWRSLLLLSAGVVLITIETTSVAAARAPQYPPPPYSPQGAPLAAPEPAETPEERSALIGVSAVVLEALLSGFANVYFEGVVKSTPLSIWHRNVQLSVWSLCIFVPMALSDGGGDVLAGWDELAVGNALMGALGGILVALCIAYFDSIAKSVAVTMSVVLTVLMGRLLLSGPMSAHIMLGSLVVIVSTINYSFG